MYLYVIVEEVRLQVVDAELQRSKSLHENNGIQQCERFVRVDDEEEEKKCSSNDVNSCGE